MSVEQIETAVAHLPAPELARFSDWFEQFKADQWDREIEADAATGRFEAAARRADADFEAGRCTAL